MRALHVGPVQCLVNGNPASSADCRALVDRVFSRRDAGVDLVEPPTGESLSLAGNSAGVDILHHRADGSSWGLVYPIDQEAGQTLMAEFLHGDGRLARSRSWEQVALNEQQWAMRKRRLLAIVVAVILPLLLAGLAARHCE